MPSQIIHNLSCSHIHLPDVLIPKTILCLEMINYCINIRLSFSLDYIADGQTVYAIAARNRWNGYLFRMLIDPCEVADSPLLQKHKEEEDKEWTEVDSEVFALVIFHYEGILH